MRISIPGLIDLLLVDDPTQVRELAGDGRLDRDYQLRGPLFNRLVLARVRRVLQLDDRPLPSVAPRGGPRPTHAQAALEERLDDLVAKGLAGPEIEALAAYVRGVGPEDKAGRLAQQAIGRLFAEDYDADAASWADAQVLDAAPRDLNLLRELYWSLTGRVAWARRRLADKVAGDPSGLHATGIAAHNLAAALQRMRQLYWENLAGPPRSAEWAVGNALVAPRQVLRQPTGQAGVAGCPYGADTLVMLQLDAANTALPSAEIVFMQGAWSRCPAHRWVPALLAAVWRRAGDVDGPRPAPRQPATPQWTPPPSAAPAPNATPPPPTPTSHLAFAVAEADNARARYQTLLAWVLLVEAAAALALALIPSTVARLAGHPASASWLRPLGVAVVVMALLLWIGRREPSRTKVISLLGIFGRPVLALVLGLAGGMLIWAGAAELVAAVLLAHLYFRYFEAEVTSRP